MFDFGSGTGILSILASKMGASSVTGIDIEEHALENAVENARLNECHHIAFYHGDQPIGDRSSYDIVIVNIIRSVILQHIKQLVNLVKPNGYILLSGYQKEDPKIDASKNERIKLWCASLTYGGALDGRIISSEL